jgi:hypothetical protein
VWVCQGAGELGKGRPDFPPDGPDGQTLATELILNLSPQQLKLGETIKVLVSLVYPGDKWHKATPEMKNMIGETWKDVAAYYRQASFGLRTIEAEVTDWHQLKEEAAFYITNYRDLGAPKVRNDQDVLARLCCEAAAAAAKGRNLGDYRILACVINLDGNEVDGKSVYPLRGYSDRSVKRFRDEALGINIPLADGPMGIMVVDERATWSRYAHELGHFPLNPPTQPDNPRAPVAFDTEDLYDDSEICANASASGFDLMGHHEEKPLYSGYHMDQLGLRGLQPGI